uniref:Putative secreted protein n=1 Tax=Anopheles triannulatus TaxID=58253 RepID=A0A2M4B176_9DIPT
MLSVVLLVMVLSMDAKPPLAVRGHTTVVPLGVYSFFHPVCFHFTTRPTSGTRLLPFHGLLVRFPGPPHRCCCCFYFHLLPLLTHRYTPTGHLAYIQPWAHVHKHKH